MYHELENMTLCEYRINAMDVLRDYKGYVPAPVWESAYFDVITAFDESTITRALHACRDAL